MKKILTIFSMVAMIACIMCSSASAAESIPRCDIASSTYPVHIYSTYDGRYYCFAMAELPSNRTATYTGHQVVLQGTDPVKYMKAVYYGGNWALEGAYESKYYEDVVAVNIGCDLYQSDVNIYDTSGELFFPLPPSLPEVVEELTILEGQNLGTEVVGTMSNLVPYGVGCLALLTGLVLLSRKLPIFLH